MPKWKLCTMCVTLMRDSSKLCACECAVTMRLPGTFFTSTKPSTLQPCLATMTFRCISLGTSSFCCCFKPALLLLLLLQDNLLLLLLLLLLLRVHILLLRVLYVLLHVVLGRHRRSRRHGR